MQSTNIQAAYLLDSKVSCLKHPSKSIEYFCRHPECTQQLFCSACILKKQFCRHDQNQYIVDISQYLYQQKLSHQMKGLSTESDIHDYMVHLEDHNKLYRGIIDEEYRKFDSELDKLLEEVKEVIVGLKENVRSQFDEYISSYCKIEENLQKRVEENFSGSFIARYSTFDEVFRKNDYNSLIGLKELMNKLNKPTDTVKLKQIRGQFQNLISMHDQIPEIDYSRYQTIKGYMKVFENKLSQAGVSIINLKNRVKEIKVDNSLPIAAVKKITHSTTFSSAHSRTIYAMGIIDNNLFVSADDGWIRVFDIAKFQCLVGFEAHKSGIRALVVQDKMMITASYDKTIKVWNFSQPIKAGKQVNYVPQKTFLGHTSSVISLKIIANNVLASGSADYNIKLWDIEKGINTRSFSGHMNDVLCLASTTAGTTLISGSADRTIKVWSLEKKYSSACLKTLTGHTDFVWTIALLSDDITLFSGGLDKLIKIWDIFTGQLIRNLPTEHTSHITRLQLLANNVLISSSHDGCLKFWDFLNNICVHTLQSKTPISAFVTIDKSTVLSAGQDKMIYVWD